MLNKYSVEDCIEQCKNFNAENGLDDYNESMLLHLQEYRDIKNSGANAGYTEASSPADLVAEDWFIILFSLNKEMSRFEDIYIKTNDGGEKKWADETYKETNAVRKKVINIYNKLT